MNEQFSVSAIAKRTGIDRRSIDRALADVRPVEVKDMGNRQSSLYDRDDATLALSRAGLPREKVARLAPFGGSVARLVTWNAYIALVRCAQHGIAREYRQLADEIGIEPGKAAEFAGSIACMVALAADLILSDCDKFLPSNAGLDEVLGFPTGADATEGAFMAACIAPAGAHEMFTAGTANKQQREAATGT